MQKKSLDSPDEVRRLARSLLDVVHLEGADVARYRFEPGWRWTEDVARIARTDLCELPHIVVQLSGTLHIEMRDGAEIDLQAGDVAQIPPGHDAWVIGDEPAVGIDFGALGR